MLRRKRDLHGVVDVAVSVWPVDGLMKRESGDLVRIPVGVSTITNRGRKLFAYKRPDRDVQAFVRFKATHFRVDD
jgi:hypothetical protein